MKTLHFYLRFRSSFGQKFLITGNIPELGNNDPEKAVPLHYLNEEFWHLVLDIPDNTPTFSYKYIFRDTNGKETTEWASDREVTVSNYLINEVQLVDIWNYPGEFENAFFTQPFLDTLLKPEVFSYSENIENNPTHIFKIKAPLLQKNEIACLMGGFDDLGDWDDDQPILMTKEGNWFSVPLNLAETPFPIAYKYGVYNIEEKRLVRYEDGNNRILSGIGKRLVSILHDGFIHLPNNTFKGAGIAIPVFSLRTETSYGIGEFTDLKGLVEWSNSVGLKLIQLLPINDTTATHTWTDSYPYAPISVFALHPVYLNIEKLAGETHSELITAFKEKQAALNALAEIDYEAVLTQKWKAIGELYPAMKKDWLTNKDYEIYYSQNKHWLIPYAAFCYLRDQNKTADFSQWKNHSVYKAGVIEKLADPAGKNFDWLGIHLFVQYQLHIQLKEAVEYAHASGIVMKGDLPIGIYRNSSDAWVEPELYNMGEQAGAPPDDFAVKGQNWGFPTYNWQRMQADGFAWWKKRFAQMSLYFDAFRIDHILGFFRIWSIPMDAVEGILGHFSPCIPVYQNEFAERSIWFDYDRYCFPFINDGVLVELFGEKADEIKNTFLNHNGWGAYSFKEPLNTQRKLEAYFQENTPQDNWIILRLYDLLSNIILIPDRDESGQTVYHFRISMDSTISFRYLDDNTKRQLKELYVNYFFKRQDDFWEKEAMQKLPALKAATRMLVCGEDLGMVPDCVPGVMQDTGLLSLEIQRMPKNPKREFFHPSDAPYMSVVTPSTHDMSTIRGWWEENASNTQAFFENELGQWGEHPFYCEPWINKAIISQHMFSPAMWAIFQLQDLLGMDGAMRRENSQEERINVPANPKHYWRYRMHLSLYELQNATGFNAILKEMVRNAGRN